ncbi:MAG: tRNA lysidine(34) synthetase TilS [Candidatus Methylacidiphilales bacterium]|nr:tRNA lysidine(34) synthetase TilS [Candidatus Methylacidiphilales bacterium]
MKKLPATALVRLERQVLSAVSSLGARRVSRALGLSGGMDSVLLAEALRRSGVGFQAWHFNHNWRGAESEADAGWVRAWCRERSVPLVPGKARAGSRRTEADARRLRWDFFRKQAARHSVGEIWLAHHADDRAETLLLQLLRGAGPAGLAGPGPVRSLFGLEVCRPLTAFTRDDLAALARHWKLSWREDSSNVDTRHRRNAVRLRLLPYLDRLTGRRVAPLLARTAEIIESENQYWDELLSGATGDRLSVAELRGQPTAWQRRRIRAWLLKLEVSDVGFEEIESVRGLLTTDKPAKVNLKTGLFARRTAGWIWLQR